MRTNYFVTFEPEERACLFICFIYLFIIIIIIYLFVFIIILFILFIYYFFFFFTKSQSPKLLGRRAPPLPPLLLRPWHIYYNPIIEVFPPHNIIPTTRHCCIVLPKAPFPLDAAVTKAVDVEESQYMCPSSRQARCTVKPTWPAGNSQTINKHVQTNKLILAGIELASPGQWFAARGFSRRLNHLI